MKWRDNFFVALLLVFIAGSTSMAHGQADPEFSTFGARLNGSKCFLGEREYARVYTELKGDRLTKWAYSKSNGINLQQYSVLMEKKRFVSKSNDMAVIGESSNDGDGISEDSA
jgi:hypothetical protein